MVSQFKSWQSNLNHEKWLEVFNDAAGGNERSIVLMRKYNGMINAKTQTILNEQFILEQKVCPIYTMIKVISDTPDLTGISRTTEESPYSNRYHHASDYL